MLLELGDCGFGDGAQGVVLVSEDLGGWWDLAAVNRVELEQDAFVLHRRLGREGAGCERGDVGSGLHERQGV